MNKKLMAMLNDTEQALVRECEPERLRALDEDALIELHSRVRRARRKYSKLYRRRANEQVTAKGRRAGASDANATTRRKAEILEDLLAKVSRRLAKVAGDEAKALRDERLAAARDAKGGSTKKSAQKKSSASTKDNKAKAAPKSATKAKKQQRTPAKKRASASAKAATKRATAKRDAR